MSSVILQEFRLPTACKMAHVVQCNHVNTTMLYLVLHTDGFVMHSKTICLQSMLLAIPVPKRIHILLDSPTWILQA